jgi:hypothetical protein
MGIKTKHLFFGPVKESTFDSSKKKINILYQQKNQHVVPSKKKQKTTPTHQRAKERNICKSRILLPNASIKTNAKR